ncbi:MAG: ABC-three component system middle component 1 [Paenibacillus sp.]|uniref:ABC-three component system middle component 1 n=1 Tax=Paenibacillus sp. TaxID=58172 RepID=UPI0029025F17|nr:ABC-three component system middle component 1 [Paenibacillus sp.]MDU2242416.1 ABC-three component system middle component 1 [Paenibacillus sp.]
MIRIINKIFEENKFNVHHFTSIPTNSFAMDNERGSYYLAIFMDENSLNDTTVDLLNSYFDEIKQLEEGYHPEMDKNLSLILCLRRENLISDLDLNRMIFQIEENPYFFKKYVLVYEDSQVELFNKKLKDYSDPTTMGYIYSVLNNENLFQEHKKDPSMDSEYSFVSKLFIKLPFLNLRKMDRNLPSLKQEINNGLSPSLLTLRDGLIDLLKEENSDENLWKESILNYIEVEKYE